jgi:hypothetical protein
VTVGGTVSSVCVLIRLSHRTAAWTPPTVTRWLLGEVVNMLPGNKRGCNPSLQVRQPLAISHWCSGCDGVVL